MTKKSDRQPQEQKQEKKREQKVIYIDDNSTIVDMSATQGAGGKRSKSTFREKLQTYFATVRKMILPMLITLLVFTLLFLLLMVFAGKF